MTKKVAIVGFAGTRDMAPFKDPDIEIWSCNNLYKFIPKTDRIFQLHRPDLLIADHHGVTGKEHIEYLQTCNIPIYMQEHYDDIPTSVRYPIEEVTEAFGIPRNGDEGVKDAYFTNTISFMIALALLEGFEEIGIYGVDMAVGTEYAEQRPSCEYYIGIAKGKGVKVIIPAEADLLKTRFMYGYEEEKAEAWQAKVKKTITDMNARKLQCEQQIQQQQSVADQYRGAIAAVQEMSKTWG